MERKVEIFKLEDIQNKVRKTKDLLGYFIENELSFTTPVDTKWSLEEQNYELLRKYENTQTITDILFDYLVSIKEELGNVIDTSVKEN